MKPHQDKLVAAFPHCSVQVGLSRHVIDRYVDTWTADITDETPRVRKIADLLARGQESAARRLLPPERPYPLPDALARRIAADPSRPARS